MENKKWTYEIKLPIDLNPETRNWMKDWIDRINDSKRVQREKKLKRILNETERPNTEN